MRMPGPYLTGVLTTAIVYASMGVGTDAGAVQIGCTAEQDFYCSGDGCATSSEPDLIEAGLSVDLDTGAGQLCEYSQCRDFTSTKLETGAFWEAQLVFGPSNFVLYQLEEGVEVQTESLLPTNGMLTIDPATNQFMLTEQSGTTVSGYLGSCEASPVP